MQTIATGCNTSATDDIAADALATGGTVLRYDGSQFIFNWKTPKQPNTCYDIVVTAQDGSVLKASFKLK